MATVAALENFRENVSSVLAARKISQRELARRIATSHPYVNRILQGQVDPGMTQCEKIADAISIPLNDLLLDPQHFSLTPV